MPEQLQEAELVMDDELLFDDKAGTLVHRERRAERLVQEGEVLAGKYRVERIPGRAGMGIIVQVRHLELGQQVTLKFLIPDACAYPEFVQRFVREARAAVKIGGEHVARVTDVGRLDSGAPYMVREFLRGPDLAEVLKVRGPLPVAEAVDYIIQAAEGVAEGHALGIVHRNLRPTTLVVTRRSDGTALVKVFDFAAAEALHVDPFTERSLSLVGTSAIMSSLPYLSPEQIRDPQDVDVRADVYALGAVLYELLTGVPAYSGDNAPSLLAAVAADAARAVRDLRPDVPGDLDHTVLRCLAKNRAIRYSSIAELVTALAQFASREVASSVERVQRLAAQAPLGAAKAAPPEPAPVASPLHWQGVAIGGAASPQRGPHGTLIAPPVGRVNSVTSDDVTVAQPMNSYTPLAQERARAPFTPQPPAPRPSSRPPSAMPVVPPPPAPASASASSAVNVATSETRRADSRAERFESAEPSDTTATTAYTPPHHPPASRARTTLVPPAMPRAARPRPSRSSLPSGMARSWAAPEPEEARPVLGQKRLALAGGGAAVALLLAVVAFRSPAASQPVAAAQPKPAAVSPAAAPVAVEPPPAAAVPPTPAAASAQAAPTALAPAVAPPTPVAAPAVVAATPAVVAPPAVAQAPQPAAPPPAVAPRRVEPAALVARPPVAPRPKRLVAQESDPAPRTASARDLFDSPE
jgi:serine/threonine protein kinase